MMIYCAVLQIKCTYMYIYEKCNRDFRPIVTGNEISQKMYRVEVFLIFRKMTWKSIALSQTFYPAFFGVEIDMLIIPLCAKYTNAWQTANQIIKLYSMPNRPLYRRWLIFHLCFVFLYITMARKSGIIVTYGKYEVRRWRPIIQVRCHTYHECI